jgi:predicted nucleic-acid-binding Zn-ribbon protein
MQKNNYLKVNQFNTFTKVTGINCLQTTLGMLVYCLQCALSEYYFVNVKESIDIVDIDLCYKINLLYGCS